MLHRRRFGSWCRFGFERKSKMFVATDRKSFYRHVQRTRFDDPEITLIQQIDTLVFPSKHCP
jgi:hypothetical protein